MNLATTIVIYAQRELHYRTVFQGLPISIENRKGSVREGKDSAQGKWHVKMTHPYGYIRGTTGMDGQATDVFLGPDELAKFAYVVTTKKSPDFKDIDEQKVMLGFPSATAAKQAFLKNYSDSRFFGKMQALPMETFKKKVVSERQIEANVGEPGVYDGGYAHIDPVPTFHPPSARKTKRVPADDPGETDNQFLDVTKRKSAATKKFRDERTRRIAIPTQLPGGPTAVNHHTAVYMPFVTN
jgi:hypothetical protein